MNVADLLQEAPSDERGRRVRVARERDEWERERERDREREKWERERDRERERERFEEREREREREKESLRSRSRLPNLLPQYPGAVSPRFGPRTTATRHTPPSPLPQQPSSSQYSTNGHRSGQQASNVQPSPPILQHQAQQQLQQQAKAKGHGRNPSSSSSHSQHSSPPGVAINPNGHASANGGERSNHISSSMLASGSTPLSLSTVVGPPPPTPPSTGVPSSHPIGNASIASSTTAASASAPPPQPGSGPSPGSFRPTHSSPSLFLSPSPFPSISPNLAAPSASNSTSPPSAGAGSHTPRPVSQPLQQPPGSKLLATANSVASSSSRRVPPSTSQSLQQLNQHGSPAMGSLRPLDEGGVGGVSGVLNPTHISGTPRKKGRGQSPPPPTMALVQHPHQQHQQQHQQQHPHLTPHTHPLPTPQTLHRHVTSPLPPLPVRDRDRDRDRERDTALLPPLPHPHAQHQHPLHSIPHSHPHLHSTTHVPHHTPHAPLSPGPIHLGTYIYPRVPFPYFHSPTYHLHREIRATILIPCGFLPSEADIRPAGSVSNKLWGGAPTKHSHRRVYTDDSDLALCAVHAGLVSWRGVLRARKRGSDLRVEVRVVLDVGVYPGAAVYSDAGGGPTGNPGEEEQVVIQSASWGNGHDGSGVEVLAAVWLERGSAHSMGVRNRKQRLKEYVQRSVQIWKEEEDEGTIVFSNGSIGFKYEPDLLSRLLFPVSPTHDRSKSRRGSEIVLQNDQESFLVVRTSQKPKPERKINGGGDDDDEEMDEDEEEGRGEELYTVHLVPSKSKTKFGTGAKKVPPTSAPATTTTTKQKSKSSLDLIVDTTAPPSHQKERGKARVPLATTNSNLNGHHHHPEDTSNCRVDANADAAGLDFDGKVLVKRDVGAGGMKFVTGGIVFVESAGQGVGVGEAGKKDWFLRVRRWRWR